MTDKKPLGTRDWFVECADYVVGPFTREGAERRKGEVEKVLERPLRGVASAGERLCANDHVITQTPTHPVGSTSEYEEKDQDEEGG